MRFITMALIFLMGCGPSSQFLIHEAGQRPTSTFDSYAKCLTPLAKQSHHRKARHLQTGIPWFQARLVEGSATPQEAYDWCVKTISEWAAEDEAEQENNDRNAKIIVGVILAAAVVYAAVKLVRVGSATYHTDVQGCCSYHSGVYAMQPCHYGRILCNDGQYSTTCTCQ